MEKVYVVYKVVMEMMGCLIVIFVKMIKGYGMGEVGEGKNIVY